MLSKLYAKWMYSWETALTTRDTNRIVRPLEWGFDWLEDFSPLAARVTHPQNRPARACEGSGPSDVGSSITFPGNARRLRTHDRHQPRHHRPSRPVLRLHHPHQLPPLSPLPPALPHQRPPRNPPGRRRNQAPGRDRRTRRGRVSPLHLTHPHPLSRKRYRQRPLVSRPPGNPKRANQNRQ